MSPVSDESPCGENLEYDPAFSNLEIIATARAEQQIGDAVAAGSEPDWQAVRTAAEELLARTKDLRVARQLARAALRLDGTAGLRDGLTLVYGLVERYWDDIHPRLDPEDDLDPTMRVNIINSLADHGDIVTPLRRLPLVSSRVAGRFGYRDILLARGELDRGEDDPVVDPMAIQAAFTDVGAEACQSMQSAIADSLNAAAAIEKFIAGKVGATAGPTLTPLMTALREIGKVLDEYAPHPITGDADETAPTESATPAGRIVAGEIRSREDVIRAIDGICAYYSRAEPASPLPFMLTRAKRLVFASFIDIMKDIAPDGLAQAQSILGAADEGQHAGG